MATSLKNLSSHDPAKIPDASGLKFGIVVSEWNDEITFSLRDACIDSLKQYGVKEEDILLQHVPGSFELTYAAKKMAEDNEDELDGVITLGCVIRGETSHFDYICQSVSYGITELNLSYDMPFIFGVLTTENLQQAKDRSGGKHGNKGDEAAITAIKMAAQ